MSFLGLGEVMYTIQVGQSDPQPVRAQLTQFSQYWSTSAPGGFRLLARWREAYTGATRTPISDEKHQILEFPRFWEQESGSNIGCQNRVYFSILTSPIDITIRLVGREWLRLLQAGKKVEIRKVGVCTANSDAHHKSQLPSEHHISVASAVPMFNITGTISLQVLPQNVMMRQVELVPFFLFIWRIKGVYWE